MTWTAGGYPNAREVSQIEDRVFFGNVNGPGNKRIMANWITRVLEPNQSHSLDLAVDRILDGLLAAPGLRRADWEKHL